MREYFILGSSPSDESCAQVGSPDYSKQMRMETRALINQLERLHPVPTNNADSSDGPTFLPYYSRKSFPHDYGFYHEVCAIYDPDHEPSQQWALEAENIFPSTWDSQARNELTSMGYEFKVEHYCESCHNMKHGPDNCPFRFQISANREDQSLLPGEFLKLIAPIGGTIEIEHTADTYSIGIENTVLFSAEKYDGKWFINWPKHLSTLPDPDSKEQDGDIDSQITESFKDFQSQEHPKDF